MNRPLHAIDPRLPRERPVLRPPIRRPPVPAGQCASVIRLGIAAVSVPTDAVQGTLALDLRGCAGMPGTPEFHLVAGQASDEVHAWAARFAQAVIEVIGGDRPLPQLIRWTSRPVYQDLGQRVRILSRSAAPNRFRTIRPQVRSVHVFQPCPDSAEVSVHVRHGSRSRALAARLERLNGQWTCTVLELG